MPETEPVGPLVEHFFRHEAGRLVSVLTRLFGWRNFNLVEETVQATLLQALQAWRVAGVPNNPSGWIHRVAKNKILDSLRRDEIARSAGREWLAQRNINATDIDDLFLDTEIQDSQLQMIFACCHPRLTPENQLALTLKTLCGFGNSEIARALLITEQSVKKRLQRATRDLIDFEVSLEPPPLEQLASRLSTVHRVLYLLFNEGYSSCQQDRAIRSDLCEEAARLCHLLCSHRMCGTPATRALLALMLFHASRLDARLDDRGFILLMEDQDRSRWDARLIQRGKEILDESAEGTAVSPYHLEAGIAYQHCIAKSYADTDWQAILELYDALLTMHDSPIYLLNRAIVIAQIQGPNKGIYALLADERCAALKHYHLYDATLGELHRRAGNLVEARHHFNTAKEKTNSHSDHELLNRRLAACEYLPMA